MTSTNINIGMTSDRASSKVLKPPGGGTSDIFGGSESEKPVVRKNDAASTNGSSISASFENGHGTQDGAEKKTSQQIGTAAATALRGRVPPGGYSSGLW